MMLPHAVPRRQQSSTNAVSRTQAVLLMIAAAVPAYFLGSITSMAAGLPGRGIGGVGGGGVGGELNSVSEMMIESRVKQRLEALEQQLRAEQQKEIDEQVSRTVSAMTKEMQAKCTPQQISTENLLPADRVGRFAVGMARTSKEEFVQQLDLGVPVDMPNPGAQDVLLLYSRNKAMPNQKFTEPMPQLGMKEAVENCDYLNVILTDPTGERKQCVAIVPQYESFHIQKWMRVPESRHPKLDSKEPLRLVSRGHQANGIEQFPPPRYDHTRKHWGMLMKYFENIDTVLAELKPILAKIAVKNTVVVMVCNFGQSELLMNFICAARKRNLDVSNVIVFTTDQETTDLVASMGLTAYFDHRNFGDTPSEAARIYGDPKFVAMMMAKVIVVQVVSLLGYDFLFQDVDMIWFKNPLDYFHDPNSPASSYDIFFQDDGGHSIRYAPYAANSGFYYVRHNDRTRHFLTSLLMAGDLILKTDSHQQALIALLAEHVSLYGLRAKVLSRDTEEFPGGFQYHKKGGEYMRAFFKGEKHPYILHMSWTLNKDNKLLYFRQIGEWYLQDTCVSKKRDEILGGQQSNLADTCCAAEPLISCHYRDKPSIIPCKDSPPIDKGKPSWW